MKKKGLVSKETFLERLETCKTCEAFNPILKTCSHCGCFLMLKAILETSECPIQLWKDKIDDIQQAGST